MSETKIRNDCQRGARGKRGPRGHEGPPGPPGPGVEGARRVIASCTVDGSVPTYLNVTGFGALSRGGPAGLYNLGLFPGADTTQINFSTGVISLDGQPALLTILSGPPGFLSVTINHLDGTPVDATFSLTAISAT